MLQSRFIGQVHEFNRYMEGEIKETIKLDMIDRKILYLLSENARLSNTYLAKKLKQKRETVAYRIKRLRENNFLHGYLTLLDHRKLGLKNYMVYIKLKTLTDEKQLLNFLFNFPEISRLKNCSGSYDIQIVFSVKKEEEFLELFEKVTSHYHQIIQSYDILEILEEDFLGLNLILDPGGAKELSILERKGSTFQREFEAASKIIGESVFDGKDKLILEELKLNGAISLKDLSGRVDLTPIAVENRIKKLIKGGIIKRFMPLASLNGMGYQWWKVFFKFRNLDRNKFFTFLKYHPNVLWYMRLLGKWDYQFSVFAKDNAEFHKVVDEIRSEFSDNIISYDSIIVFNQFKYVQRVE